METSFFLKLTSGIGKIRDTFRGQTETEVKGGYWHTVFKLLHYEYWI